MCPVSRQTGLAAAMNAVEAIVEAVEDGLLEDFASLEATVGDESAGLVKDVSDALAAPIAGTATLDETKKIITIPFNVVPYNATGLLPIDIKPNFTISTDGEAYSALGGSDQLSIGGLFVQITLDAALSTATNTIKIEADTLVSALGTPNAEIITNNLDAS
ncbi:MAG: hypothetical protein PHE79_09685 [Eubacteriales bacterium]|nr:hypothetical protein [Eubacteriales bacterium]